MTSSSVSVSQMSSWISQSASRQSASSRRSPTKASISLAMTTPFMPISATASSARLIVSGEVFLPPTSSTSGSR